LGGDDKEHEITIANPAKKMGEFRYSVKRFHGIDDTQSYCTVNFVELLGNTTVYVDNVFFTIKPHL
jgi:hypothetical protein